MVKKAHNGAEISIESYHNNMAATRFGAVIAAKSLLTLNNFGQAEAAACPLSPHSIKATRLMKFCCSYD